MESEAAAGKDEMSVSQTHSGSGDNVAGDKIGRQVNMGANSTYVENTTPEERVELPPPKAKILFIAASPEDRDQIKVRQEWQSIQNQIRQGRHRELYVFLAPQLALTIPELIRSMSEKPQIVHFSGHGGSGGLVIENPDGTSQILPAAAMRRLFKPLLGVGQVVLLNACYSSLQAEEISKYGLYVVGTNQPISDDAAIAFSSGLYIGLGEGKTFEDAFNDAMISVLAVDVQSESAFEVWKDGQTIDI